MTKGRSLPSAPPFTPPPRLLPPPPPGTPLGPLGPLGWAGPPPPPPPHFLPEPPPPYSMACEPSTSYHPPLPSAPPPHRLRPLEEGAPRCLPVRAAPPAPKIITHASSTVAPEIPARFDLKSPRDGRRFRSRKENPTLSVKRGCTDIICSFLFIVFLAGWAVVAGIAFMWGNPERLIHPTDSLGRTCGTVRKGAYNLSDKPYLFFFDLTKCISFSTVFTGCQTPQVCVAECPTEYFSYLQIQRVTGSISSEVQKHITCVDGVSKDNITTFPQLKALIEANKCNAYTVKSSPVIGRCIPQVVVGAVEGAGNAVNNGANSLDELKNKFGPTDLIPWDSQLNDSTKIVDSMVNGQSAIVKVASDISVSWWAILTLIIAAAVLAFLWTVLLRILGSFMIWTSILFIIGVLAGGAGFSWWKWNALTQAGAINDYSFQPMFSLYFEMPTTWMVIAIIISVLFLIVFLITLCIRSRIRIAVAMIEESSKALGSMISTLFFPLFPFALHFMVFVIWASITIWLASAGRDNCRDLSLATASNPYGPSCDCLKLGILANCSYVNVTRDVTAVAYMQGFNLFAFFWVTCFITALEQIALAGAFASHYWAADKKRDVPTFPVFRALKIAMRYHIGSLAFGSLLVAITKFIRVILDYLDKKLSTTQNPALHCIFVGLKCFFWCLEVFFKFLTKNAFIMMAIYGKNFFTSAKDSFSLLARNIVRTVVINNVTAFLLLIGRLTITSGMGVIAYFYFSGHWIINGLPVIQLYYYFVPIIIVVIGSFFITDLFFDVYEMAVDTTFICFLEDSEHNDGSPARPYFMSPQLQKILGKKNQSGAQQKDTAM